MNAPTERTATEQTPDPMIEAIVRAAPRFTAGQLARIGAVLDQPARDDAPTAVAS